MKDVIGYYVRDTFRLDSLTDAVDYYKGEKYIVIGYLYMGVDTIRNIDLSLYKMTKDKKYLDSSLKEQYVAAITESGKYCRIKVQNIKLFQKAMEKDEVAVFYTKQLMLYEELRKYKEQDGLYTYEQLEKRVEDSLSDNKWKVYYLTQYEKMRQKLSVFMYDFTLYRINKKKCYYLESYYIGKFLKHRYSYKGENEEFVDFLLFVKEAHEKRKQRL